MLAVLSKANNQKNIIYRAGAILVFLWFMNLNYTVGQVVNSLFWSCNQAWPKLLSKMFVQRYICWITNFRRSIIVADAYFISSQKCGKNGRKTDILRSFFLIFLLREKINKKNVFFKNFLKNVIIWIILTPENVQITL